MGERLTNLSGTGRRIAVDDTLRPADAGGARPADGGAGAFVRVRGRPPAFVNPTRTQGGVVDSSLGSRWDGAPIVRKNGDRSLRITPITRELLRIEEIGPGQVFVDDPTYFAMNRGATSAGLECRIMELDGRTVVDTGAMRLTFAPDGKPLHAGNLEVRSSPGASRTATYRRWRWDPSKPNEDRNNLGGGFRTQDLHGVGQEKDHHGGLQLDNGVVSKQGFFCYDDSRGPIFRDGFPRRRTADEQGTDLYLFGYGRDYPAALRGLAQIGCPTPMPRGPMLGAIDSWWQPLTDAQYRERAESYLAHGYPLDALVFDMDALAPINPAYPWSRWSWNESLIPDPKGLTDFLHDRSLVTALNLHPYPGVARGERGYEPLMQALRDNGYLDDHPGDTVTADLTDPRYVGPWIEHVLTPLREDGVDTWWLDYQPTQGKEIRGPPEHTAIEGLPTGALLAHLLYHQSTGLNVAAASNDPRPANERPRGALLARFEGPQPGAGPGDPHGLLGSHRYPMQFSGDTFVQFPILAAQVRMTIASANVLAAFWSHDIGGLLHEKEPQLFARWTWFGALSTCLRIHGFNNDALAGHDPVPHSDGDPRPWLYGDQCTEATRRAYHLRSQLFPYIYSQVWTCHRDAMPPIQPMYLRYPNQRQAHANAQQYMLGDSVVVSPIVRDGRGPNKVASAPVWFPEGRWYHLLTGERFDGDSRSLVSGDLNEVPAFAKGGVPIATQPVSMHMGSEQVHTLVVRAYPGKDGARGESVLHEDDRLTQAYREGGFASTKMSYRRDGDTITLEVAPAVGSFEGQPETREFRFELPETEPATGVEVNGRRLEALDGASIRYDHETRTNLVTLPRTSIREGLELRLEARDADPKQAKAQALARRLAGRFEEVDLGLPLGQQIRERAAALGDPAKAEQDDRLAGLLELAGIGFETPEQGPYGWSPYATRLLQPFYGDGAVDVKNVRVSVEDRAEGASKTVLSLDLSPDRSGRENIPLPALESNGALVERFATMECTVEGRPLSLTRRIGATSMRRAFAPTNPDPHHPSQPHPRDVTPEVRVNGVRVDETDRIGLASDGHHVWVDQAIRTAVGRHGGPKGIGYPASYYPDQGEIEARLAHRWFEDGRDLGVTLQNFDWGGDPSYGGACVVVHRDGSDAAFVIRGDFWRAYSDRSEDGRCAGRALGFPVADEVLVDGRRTQRFEHGSMTEVGPERFEFQRGRGEAKRNGAPTERSDE